MNTLLEGIVQAGVEKSVRHSAISIQSLSYRRHERTMETLRG
jgi:hypothetical protein